MSVISKLPSGGGLSKTNPITTYDIKKSASYGDIEKQLITSLDAYTKGTMYYEEYDSYIKLYVLVHTSSDLSVKTFTIDVNGVTEGASVVLSGATASALYTLKGDKNSNVMVVSVANTTTTTLYCINKNTLSVTTITAPRYNSSTVNFRGATVRDGVIYASMWCNASQPYLYKYDESGATLGYFENSIGVIYLNAPACFDNDDNIYISCDGNSSNLKTLVSITSDGTLRWSKTQTDLGTSKITLLNVNDDGQILCLERGSSTKLYVYDKSGNSVKTIEDFFKEYSWYAFTAKYMFNGELIQIQDVGGTACYLCDRNFNKLESFTVTSDNGRPVAVFTKNKLVVVREEGTLRVEVRKPYVEYIKR